MRDYLYKVVRRMFPRQVAIADKPLPISGHAKLSFSQEGEDMLLDRFFMNQKDGFYVDVGAHHPERFSNTNYYYLRGWRGINIEADPSLMKEFDEMRSDDININVGVGTTRTTKKFYIFNETAINTFDKKLAEERKKIEGYYIEKIKDLSILPLSDILESHLSRGKEIDFMTIDVEGLDLEVLQSNNWKLYRPRFVLVECLKKGNLQTTIKDPVVKFMGGINYEPFAKTHNTVFFKDTSTEL